MQKENFTVITHKGKNFVDIASEDAPDGFATVWSFGVKQAQLLASAPKLLHALRELQANPNDPRAHRTALDAMATATGTA